MYKEQFELHAAIEDVHWWFVARRAIVTSLINEVISVRRGHTVLEIGVGTGGNLKSFASDYNCIGVDIDAAAVSFARLRAQHAHIYHGDVLGDLKHTVIDAEGVLMLDVLEHIKDDRGFLQGVIELMKPGAYAFITVPARRELWSMHDVHHHHHRRYMPSDFRDLWSNLPVEVALFSYFNSRLFYPISFVRKRNVASGVTYGDAGTDLRLPNKWCNRVLQWIFQGEKSRLKRVLAGSRCHEYRIGVSLIAILRKIS